MMCEWRKNRLSLVVLTLLLALSIVATACGGTATTPGTEASAGSDTGNQLAVVNASELLQTGAAEYLAKGLPPVMSPDDVYNNIVVGGDPNYALVDVRSAKAFEAAHIQGAINIPFADIAKADSLSQVAKDKKVVVICYSGHTAGYAAMLYNLLGYEAYTMTRGMMGWSDDASVIGTKPWDCQSGELPTDTQTVETSGDNELPAISADATDLEGVVLAQAQKFIDSGNPLVMKAGDVYNNVVAAQDPNYVIVDIRAARDYEKGHVPGAINIPSGTLADAAQLAKLPADKKLVVVCYSGHTASLDSMFLNLMGYNATAMAFGMQAWAPNSLSCEKPNYPTVSGR